MIFFPYSSPIILNDTIFVQYGGHTGTNTAAQRQMAYLLAEQTAYDDLHTFLLPIIVTGTYAYSGQALVLENNFIRSVKVIQFLNSEEAVYWAVTGTNNIYANIFNADRGILDIPYVLGHCNCHSTYQYPYQVRVMYECGLPTGTANQPDVLMALTNYADIMLNEINGYGNEAPGDIGVQSFSNQDYSERRVALYQTAWGSSPKARLAHRLLTRFRKRKWVGL